MSLPGELLHLAALQCLSFKYFPFVTDADGMPPLLNVLGLISGLWDLSLCIHFTAEECQFDCVTKVKHLIRETNGDKEHWLFRHPVLNYWITHGIHLIFVNLMVVEIEIIIDNFLYPFTSFNN